MVGCPSLSGPDCLMPHKHNADRRHHIPKMSFKVRNWPAYEAGLRRRGSLTLWIEGRSAGMLADHWAERAGSVYGIAEQGHLAWQTTTGYGQRSLVETTMGRYKFAIGPRLRARGFPAQQTEAD